MRLAHDRFRRFNTTGRWPNQKIDYDVSLMVRARGRHLFLGGLTGFDLEGRFHGKGDPAAQADQAMKNLKILVEEAGGTLQDVCKVTTYLLERAHREPVYNTVARHLVALRAYVTDIAEFNAAGAAIGAAWGATLGRHFPAMTLVEVAGLVEAQAKVEIEATAVLPRR